MNYWIKICENKIHEPCALQETLQAQSARTHYCQINFTNIKIIKEWFNWGTTIFIHMCFKNLYINRVSSIKWNNENRPSRILVIFQTLNDFRKGLWYLVH